MEGILGAPSADLCPKGLFPAVQQVTKSTRFLCPCAVNVRFTVHVRTVHVWTVHVWTVHVWAAMVETVGSGLRVATLCVVLVAVGV